MATLNAISYNDTDCDSQKITKLRINVSHEKVDQTLYHGT